MRIWDLETGRAILGPLEFNEHGVSSIGGATLDGEPIIVSGGEDGSVAAWDLQTGELIHASLTAHGEAVDSVMAGTYHGQPMIVSASGDGTVRVWGLRQHLGLRIDLQHRVTSAVLAADRLVIATTVGLVCIELPSKPS